MTRLRAIAGPTALVILFLVIWVLPAASRSAWNEVTTAPDEAAHYVTSLMIRGYVADAFGDDPRRFAEQYYIHYPKVAFGIWPPLFHVMLAGWMLVTGASLSSAVLFVSLATVLLAFVMFWAARDSLGIPLALVTALWFATFPQVQISASAVMTDMHCALMSLCAAVAFGHYMDSQRTRHALLFAGFAAAALLTKYNALALSLVPALAVLAGRRWSLLGRANFWAIPVVVFTVCAPWYVFQWQMVRYASEPIPPPNAWISMTQANAVAIVNQVGWVPLFLASLGVYRRVLSPEERNGLWCGLFALGAALWIFHTLVYPIVAERYLIAGFAVLALFSAAGLHWLAMSARWVHGDNAFRVRLAACAVALFALATSAVPVKAGRGFAQAADVMLSESPSDDTTALVSSDVIGEGAFIAHVATREPRPRRIILRGSKFLATGTWMGLNYAQRYPEASSLLLALDRARVEYIAIDDASHEEHHRQLDAAIRDSTAWVVIQPLPSSPKTSGVRLYRRTRALPPGRPEFDLDMSYSLGTKLRPQVP